jgi:hypothetical protein
MTTIVLIKRFAVFEQVVLPGLADTDPFAQDLPIDHTPPPTFERRS